MFDRAVATITALISRNNNWLGLTLLGSSALLEYVFPPFPGDAVALFGSFLVMMQGWSMPHVYAALMVGAGLGAMIDYAVGIKLGNRYRAGKVFTSPAMRARVDRVMQAFQRYGPAYVIINRFLPGIRAVIFIAAGMAGLRASWVLIFALVSAALWNGLILLLGYLVGANWERITAIMGLYGRVIYTAMGLLVAGLVLCWLLRRRRASGSR